jgi:predicted Zn-dependent protease
MQRGAAILSTIAMVWLVLSGCAVNPATGDKDLMLFSPEDDIRMGMSYAPEVEKELGGRIADENLQEYVNKVGQKIARVCQRPDIAYHFTAVEEPMVNAFALPGGYIFITRGLLEKLDSEAQMAAILAHEVGHVVARDTLAAISRQIGMTGLVAAASVSGSGDVAAASYFISTFLSLQYSRDDEKDADMSGLGYMIQAGYDPNGMLATMHTLAQLQTVRPIEFFSTHPNPENRIIYLEERIERRYADLGQLKTGKSEYQENVLARLKEHKGPRRPLPPHEMESQ